MATQMTEFIEEARENGIFVDTYSPGDGITRYRFFKNPGNDYFGPDNGIYTALGRNEAVIFLTGWAMGRNSRIRA